ncbi:hypothetical protein [Actinoplanes sp. NPDC026670]
MRGRPDSIIAQGDEATLEYLRVAPGRMGGRRFLPAAQSTFPTSFQT